MTLGMKILIGVAAGIVTGIFLGDLTTPFEVVGDIYVGLLQMTVLPYVTVSLIGKIGKLTGEQAKTLAGRAGIVLLALWGISLGTVLVMPMSLPDWDAGAFFTSSLVEVPGKFDFLGLYLPTNPFHSLANNVVPAVVIFSILVGAALIAIPKKNVLLEPLGVVSDALGAISNFIVKLSPYGTFALAAAAAGTLSPDKLARLSGYVSTYTFAVILLTFVVLPGFASALTPFRFRTVVRGSRDAILTAFATGKLFAVLPMIIRDSKNLLVEQGTPPEEAEATADVFVPLGYPFPNAGKILSILFIPFAAWFIGRPLEIEQYPMLLTVGLFAFFGSPVAAIPFLLDMLRLPSDMLPLFLVAGIWCARIGDVLGAMHLTVFTLICSSWNRGLLRLQPVRIGRWLGVSAVLTAATLAVNHAVIRKTLAGQRSSGDLVASMDLTQELTAIEVRQPSEPNPSQLKENENFVERIRRTGELRVGLVAKEPPFSYRNAAQKKVGFDIDFIQILARDLAAKLVLFPVKHEEIGPGLKADHFDLAIGAIPSTIRNFDFYHESRPYLDLHAALLVRDHRVKEFRTVPAIHEAAARDGVRFGYEKGGIFVQAKRAVPGIETVEVESGEAFLRGEIDVDAMLVSAETGAVLTMLYPEFSVVIPEGIKINIPIVIAIRDAPELQRLVDSWIQIRENDGTIQALYDYWVLGKTPQTKHTRRWSVIRDALGWVE